MAQADLGHSAGEQSSLFQSPVKLLHAVAAAQKVAGDDIHDQRRASQRCIHGLVRLAPSRKISLIDKTGDTAVLESTPQRQCVPVLLQPLMADVHCRACVLFLRGPLPTVPFDRICNAASKVAFEAGCFFVGPLRRHTVAQMAFSHPPASWLHYRNQLW